MPGVVLPAEERDFSFEGRVDLFPHRDVAALGPNLAQFLDGDFLDRIGRMRIDGERVVSDDEFLHVLAGDLLYLRLLLGLHFARGVADFGGVVLQRGDARARAAAVGVDEDVGLDLAIGFGPGGRELDHRVRTLGADFDGFLACFSASPGGAACR